MRPPVMIEVPADREALVRRLPALTEELDHLALTAPAGTIFDACETAVVIGGRAVPQQMLEQAVARRLEAAEKKGPRSASVCAGDRRKTGARKPVN